MLAYITLKKFTEIDKVYTNLSLEFEYLTGHHVFLFHHSFNI